MTHLPAYSVGPTHFSSNPFDPPPTDTLSIPIDNNDTLPNKATPTPLPTHWQGRTWSYRRMAPALLVLVACIAGVVCSLMWNFYLLIPFGPGFLGSLYLLRLGCHDQELITLSENLAVLNVEIGELNKQIDQFEEENQKLKQTLKGYIGLYQKFTGSVKDLSGLKTEFEATNEVAKAHNQALQRTVEKLEKLKGEFESFSSNLTEEQTRFEKNLGAYRNQVEEQCTILATHLECLSKLMSDPHQREAYQKHINLIKEQGKIQSKLAVSVVRLEENTKHIEDLKQVKENLEKEVNKLTEQVTKLEKVVTSYEQVSHTAKI